MSYKTILVHLNNTRRAEAVLEPAVRAGGPLQLPSHRDCMCTPACRLLPLRLPRQPRCLRAWPPAKHQAQRRDRRRPSSGLTANKSFVAGLAGAQGGPRRPGAGGHGTGPRRRPDHGGADRPRLGPVAALDFPERLALEGGRPVLVIPYAGRHPKVGQNVVIAWKARHANRRAPYSMRCRCFKGAQNVHILGIPGPRQQEAGAWRPIPRSRRHWRGMASSPTYTYLGCFRHQRRGQRSSRALPTLDADLLVMGAYGHSRMRELVFGGVTRHIAQHMTVPTLFSH